MEKTQIKKFIPEKAKLLQLCLEVCLLDALDCHCETSTYKWKGKKKVCIPQSEPAVLLSYMLIVTYGCYKDKHNFYIGPTSAGAKMVSHVAVIGTGQIFQLLKSRWAIFYRGREFSSSALARLHYTKLYSLLPGTHCYHLQKQEPCLPSASPQHVTLSLCPQDELCRSILKQFWEFSQVNILPGECSPSPSLHHGSLQYLIDDCARNSQPISTPFMLPEFKLLFQGQI